MERLGQRLSPLMSPFARANRKVHALPAALRSILKLPIIDQSLSSVISWYYGVNMGRLSQEGHYS